MEETMEMIPAKKRFTFGKGLLVYVAVWIVLTAGVCAKLWSVLANYQNGYDTAQENANPDLLMPEIVQMFSAEQIAETAGGEWCTGVSEYELDGAAEALLVQAVEGKSITYRRNDAYTDRHPLYDVYADDEAVGLVRLKQESASDAYGFHLCTLESAQVLITPPQLSDVTVTVADGGTLLINGQTVSDDYITQTQAYDSAMAQEAAAYSGITHETCTYVVEGFVNEPEVQVEESSSEIEAETEERVLAAAQAYAQNMNAMANFATVAQYLENGSAAYEAVSSAQSGLKWAGKPDEFEIKDTQITDYVSYGEDAFTVTTTCQTYRLYREVEYEETQTFEWFYVKSGETWMIRNFALAR